MTDQPTATPTTTPAKSGDACPRCLDGMFYVRSSHPRGTVQVKYLSCDRGCGETAREVVPAEQIRRRRKRKRTN